MSAISPDIPAIYQNTFSNCLPSECRASAARVNILAIYFYFYCKSFPKGKAKNTAQMVRLSLRNSCIPTVSPDKLNLLMLRSQPIRLNTLSAVGGTQVSLGKSRQGWKVFLLGSPPGNARHSCPQPEEESPF